RGALANQRRRTMDGEHLSVDGPAPPGHLARRRCRSGQCPGETAPDENAAFVCRIGPDCRTLAAIPIRGCPDALAVLPRGTKSTLVSLIRRREPSVGQMSPNPRAERHLNHCLFAFANCCHSLAPQALPRKRL